MKADGGWTKGPWSVRVEVCDMGGWAPPVQNITISAGSQIVASYSTEYAEYPDDATNVANAHIQGAAPELYEALATLANKYARRGPFDELLGASEQPAEIIAAIAALAKARGESATGGME